MLREPTINNDAAMTGNRIPSEPRAVTLAEQGRDPCSPGADELSANGSGQNARIPCSHFHETRATALRLEEVGQTGFRKLGLERFPRRYYPDRVRGYLLSPTRWSTPVSILTIETPAGVRLQIVRRVRFRGSSACFVRSATRRSPRLTPLSQAELPTKWGGVCKSHATVRAPRPGKSRRRC